MACLGHSTPAAAMRYQHAAQGRDQAIAELLSQLVGDTLVTLHETSPHLCHSAFGVTSQAISHHTPVLNARGLYTADPIVLEILSISIG